MPKFNVVYRGEFEATVIAKDSDEAIYKFKRSQKIKCCEELHEDFFAVIDKNGRNLLVR